MVLIALCSTTSFGQNNNDKKTIIGLLTFEAIDPNNFREAEQLTDEVKKLFVESKRYIPVDRSQYAETAKFTELEVQKNIVFINGEVAKQGRQKGAKFLVGGKLTGVEYVDLKKGLDCKLTFSISITNVETGELLATETFKPGPIPSADGIEEITALATQLTLYRNKISNFIIANTPFYAEVVKLDKSEAEVYLNVGESEGIEKGNRFAIYQVSELAGEVWKQEVLKFSIDKVQGGISVGGIKRREVDELDKLMNDPEIVLSVEEIECKLCINNILD